MAEYLDRLQRKVDDLARHSDLLAGVAADLHDAVGELRAARKQPSLPGIDGGDVDGEELAGVPALEARIAALEGAIGSAIGALGSLSAPTPTRNARAQNILRAALGAAGETHSARSGQAAD